MSTYANFVVRIRTSLAQKLEQKITSNPRCVRVPVSCEIACKCRGKCGGKRLELVGNRNRDLIIAPDNHFKFFFKKE